MADEQEVKEGEVEQANVETGVEEVVEETEEQKVEREKKEQEQAKEKKFTDDDMKKTRESLQRAAREREARIIAETEARVLREALEGKSKPTDESKEPEVPKERPIRPVEGDFQTREEFLKAQDKFDDELYAWRTSQDRKRDEERQARETESKSKTAMQKAVEKVVEDGNKLYSDFDEVVKHNKQLAVTPMMTVAITKMPNAADVVYHLGKNPEESYKLADIVDPIDLTIAVREISDRLHKKEKPAVKTKTAAPAPAATVQAKSRVQTDTSLDGKSQSERIALMEEASKKRRLARAGRT